MAFTGTPVVEAVGFNIKRITGVTLAAGAQGSVGGPGSGADIELPVDTPTIDKYTIPMIYQLAIFCRIAPTMTVMLLQSPT
jgi:hypothetical protein